MNTKKAVQLFLTFLKIGTFTFGGGYAMIPLIQKETVENKKWITDDDILNIIAIAESTPGPIAINTATFIGYKTAGIFGALCATLGVVLPSFVIITIIALLLNQFQNYKGVQYAFFGIRAGVLALVIKALITMYSKMPKNKLSYILAAFALLMSVFTDVNLILIIAVCAVVGFVCSTIKARRADIQ